MSRPDVSVVVCVYNGAPTLPRCLAAIQAQILPGASFEVLVVDDGSTDDSAKVAADLGTRVISGPHRGLAAARNIGWQASEAEWIAFTDDDCSPMRNWLQNLWRVVQSDGNQERVLGAAGRIIGFPSTSPVSRYIESAGGFNTDVHLAHPIFPYAPMGNIIYRREALASVHGLDERYDSYESCDLHTRLRRHYGGSFVYVPQAVVLHQHYASWSAYFRQQKWYGRGMGQFMWQYRHETTWSIFRELKAWANIFAGSAAVLFPGNMDDTLERRGSFLKQLGLRLGFIQTYWNPRERRRW